MLKVGTHHEYVVERSAIGDDSKGPERVLMAGKGESSRSGSRRFKSGSYHIDLTYPRTAVDIVSQQWSDSNAQHWASTAVTSGLVETF